MQVEQRRRLRGVRRGAPRGRDRHRVPALPDRHGRHRRRHRRGRHAGPRRRGLRRRGRAHAGRRPGGPVRVRPDGLLGGLGRAARDARGRSRCPSSAPRWPRPRPWPRGPRPTRGCATGSPGSDATSGSAWRCSPRCWTPRSSCWAATSCRSASWSSARPGATLEQRLVGPVRGARAARRCPRDRGRRSGRGGAGVHRGLLRRARAVGLSAQPARRARTSWIALPRAVTGSTKSGSKAISAAPSSTESRPRAGSGQDDRLQGGGQRPLGETGVDLGAHQRVERRRSSRPARSPGG